LACRSFVQFADFASRRTQDFWTSLWGDVRILVRINQNKVLDFDQIEHLLDKVFKACRAQPDRLALDVLLEQRP